MKKLFRILPLLLTLALVLPACSETSEEFTYSGAFDSKGYWKGITALKYVDLCELDGITIPASVHSVSDELYTETLNELLLSYGLTEDTEVTDRAVVDGDTLNIDYVGYIDNIAFDGGSTGGAGTEVTIGVTSYIDDFLEQLIGHTPGESFDIEVTFPEDYGNEELNGKDAVFAITINYIVDRTYPELTDDIVTENFTSSYGWQTAEEMRQGVIDGIRTDEIESYINNYLVENCTISSLPEKIYQFQVDSTVDYYQTYADYYGVTLDEFISYYVGYSSMDALIEATKTRNTEASEYYLVIQAVAEKKDITVSEDDVTNYFVEYFGTSDYSAYEEAYGLPYLKWIVLSQKVTTYIADNAVYAD